MPGPIPGNVVSSSCIGRILLRLVHASRLHPRQPPCRQAQKKRRELALRRRAREGPYFSMLAFASTEASACPDAWPSPRRRGRRLPPHCRRSRPAAEASPVPQPAGPAPPCSRLALGATRAWRLLVRRRLVGVAGLAPPDPRRSPPADAASSRVNGRRPRPATAVASAAGHSRSPPGRAQLSPHSRRGPDARTGIAHATERIGAAAQRAIQRAARRRADMSRGRPSASRRGPRSRRRRATGHGRCHSWPARRPRRRRQEDANVHGLAPVTPRPIRGPQ